MDGKVRTRAEIVELLGASLIAFIPTLELLKASVSHFYDYDLVASALKRLSEGCKISQDAINLADLVKEIKDLVDEDCLKLIANRLFDFGEFNVGFEILLLAYNKSNEYHYGASRSQPILNELCQRDRERVADHLVMLSERSFLSDSGGFDLPRMLARYFLATEDFSQLRKVFDDYCQHCEELFTHLPGTKLFEWLNSDLAKKDESTEVVDFVIDIIGEPEIELSHRLMSSLIELARSRPELVGKVLASRMALASPLLRERLEVIWETLSRLCPEEMRKHVSAVLPLLKESNFRTRSVVIRSIRHLSTKIELSASILAELADAERVYSPTIVYPNRRYLEFQPTPEFVHFCRTALFRDTQIQIKGISNLLDIEYGVVMAHIEQKLKEEGWTQEAEIVQLRDEWYGQGRDGKVVWIVPQFQVKVSGILQNLVHFGVEKGRYHPKVVKTLESVVHGGDPEFFLMPSKAKPTDIPVLDVTDVDSWINDMDQDPKLEVLEIPNEWITVFEKRKLSQTDGSRPLFQIETEVIGILVHSGLIDRIGSLPDSEDWMASVPFMHPAQRFCLLETQNELMIDSKTGVSPSGKLDPLLSYYGNREHFPGFEMQAFLHPLWIQRYNLTFDGLSILQDGRNVGKYESWREGYQDEVYSRDRLSWGVRLLLDPDFVNVLLGEFQYALLLNSRETRRKTKDPWRDDPGLEAVSESRTCLISKSP